MRKMLAVLAVGLGLAFGGWRLRAAGQDDRKTWESRDGQAYVRIPEFVWKPLSSPAARKANFWIGADGQILRYTVYVDKAALPDWIHALADERIGKGEDVAYELEIYPDGSQVYEIYRRVDGLERQLSVRADRSVYYIGQEQAVDKLPDAVLAALGDRRGLTIDGCALKEGPDVAEYHLKAMKDGVPCRLRVSKAGRLLAVQRKIFAEVEVPLSR